MQQRKRIKKHKREDYKEEIFEDYYLCFTELLVTDSVKDFKEKCNGFLFRQYLVHWLRRKRGYSCRRFSG